MEKYVVTIGAGHGGHDCGVVGPSGVMEKDAALNLSLRTAELMNSTGCLRAIPIRSGDVYIDTARRAEIIADSGSRCHIELHFNALDSRADYTEVWHSFAQAADRAHAEYLSRRIAQVLDIRDGGPKARIDYGALLGRTILHEDYLGLFELLEKRRIPHVFLAECGCIDHITTEQKINDLYYMDRIAQAITQTVCEIFSLSGLKLRLSKQQQPQIISPKAETVFLKNGSFQVFSGPGPYYSTVRIIRGLIYTRCYQSLNGWIKISPSSEEWISATAIKNFLDRKNVILPDCEATAERVGKAGFFYVKSAPDVRSDVLGAVTGGERWTTISENGWRKICFDGRIGYVGAYPWQE
ncbi:MAG TPA: N-acetylmuramoyl-L-alanine amidase [Clostridia bacterium]|nr:N-acetylmuramoyl-L-alanine amidase [Clostridia bacterium]